MNFSSNMKPPHKRRATYWVDLVVGFLVGALIAALIGLAVFKITTKAEAIHKPAQKPPITTLPPNTAAPAPAPVEPPRK